MTTDNIGVEPYNSLYERGYVAGLAERDLPADAPGRFEEEYMNGYEDGLADAKLIEQEAIEEIAGIDLEKWINNENSRTCDMWQQYFHPKSGNWICANCKPCNCKRCI